MRSDREKLIALIQAAVNGCSTYWAGLIADHLIANGVTFATDNHVGGKWIPVTERLPESRGYYLVMTKSEGVAKHPYSAQLQEFIAYEGATNSDFFIPVTHWMPLPEPPKEEA